MPSKEELWSVVEPVARSKGVELFDLEVPRGANGILKIFITRGALSKEGGKESGVNVDDCAAVSRALSDDETGFEAMLPDKWLIEVSSPGVNRKLGRSEHFHGAVGERIKLKAALGESNEKQILRGILVSFDGREAVIDDETLKTKITVPFEKIRDAAVDFQF